MNYIRLTIFISFLVIVSINSGCTKSNSTSNDAVIENSTSKVMTSNDIEALEYTEYVLSDSAEEVVSNWLKFQELSTEIGTLKKADLSFFGDDKELLSTFVVDLKNEIPEVLNESSIVVRLLALETNLYKLHDESIFNKDSKEHLLAAVKEVLIGYTNLIFQINKKLEKDAQKIEKPN